MVSVVTLLRLSRTPNNHSIEDKGNTHHAEHEDDLYLPSTAVFLTELLKLIICMTKLSHSVSFSPPRTLALLRTSLPPLEVLKLSVPCLLYLLQNNLLFLALTKLDATTYQVTYQLKILTTALFSVLMIPHASKKMTPQRWFSLLTLFLFVALSQTSPTTGDARSLTATPKDRTIGLICVITASCTSGFAGVYFEMVLKGSKTDLWVRNVQMGLPSVLLGFLSTYFKDGVIINERGFLHGYTPLVWVVISVQAGGGLLVAVVVKYADNIMKVFATSIAIVIGAVVNAVVGGFRPDFRFIVGAAGVCGSTVMYGTGGRKEKVGETDLPLVKVQEARIEGGKRRRVEEGNK